LIIELYGQGEATLANDLHTSLPAAPPIQRCAEHFRVTDGRISPMSIISDATPWRPIIQAAADVSGPGGWGRRSKAEVKLS
jgi:hypothetical protein